MGVENTITAGALIISNSDAAASVLADSSAINILSTSGQVIAGIASVSPAGTIATAPGAAVLTIGKISADAAAGNQISAGDILSVAGNVVGIIGAVGAVTVGGAVILPAAAIGLALASLGALSNTPTGQGWLERSRNWLNDLVSPDTSANVDPSINRNWQDAKNPPPRDPLAIDLGGDGIQTVGIPVDGTPILFDHNADGIKTGTGWLLPADAWLVLDRNGNGTIDSGRELFGADTLITTTRTMPGVDGAPPATYTVTRTANTGFEALAASDANGDGIFNAQDADFSKVRLWQDLNQDGISQSAELFTLAEKNIVSVSLTPDTELRNLGNGNSITGHAKVVRSDQSTTSIDSLNLQAGNLNLIDNPFYRQFSDTIALSDAARALPGMNGSGLVRDLREAMSLGNSDAGRLVQAVTDFAAGATREQQLARLDNVVDQWAKSSGRADVGELRPVSRTIVSESGSTRSVRITAMDPANYPNPSSNVVPCASFVLPDSYYSIVVDSGVSHKELNAKGREVLRRLSDLEIFNGARFIDFTVNEVVGSGSGSGSGGGGSGGGTQSSGFQVRYQVSLAEVQITALNSAYDALLDSVYSGLVVQTRLKPYLDEVSLVFDAGRVDMDTSGITAKLEAKKSADPRGALVDLVELNRYSGNTLRNIDYDSVGLLRSWVESIPAGSALLADLAALQVFSAADAVTVGSTRGDIYFGDGIANLFQGGAGADMLDGGAGDDQLYGGADNDLVLGGRGNDTLYGDSGNDTLDGGTGNDYLGGGAGADTYLFAKGSGQDTVYNYDGDTVGTNADTIKLGAGILPSGVTLTRSGDDLLIGLNGTNDSLRVQSYFYADGVSGYSVENLVFADGTSWNLATVKAKVQQSTSGNDVLYGYATNDSLSSGDGNDTVYGYGGDDVLDGGTGADNLQGGDGNDTVKGGTGADYLYGGNGNDSLQGNEHNDTLYGDAGSDTLDGGTGNDYLSGGAGADTYLFAKGSGQDTVYNYDGDTVGTNADAIKLGAGILPSGVTLTRSGDDLLIGLNGTNDSLRVQSYFYADGASGYSVENLVFADGTSWNLATVKAKVQQSTSGNDVLYGYATNDSLSSGDGNDTVYGYGGDDVLDGGTGADNLQGGEGNDTVKGGTGADYLYGGNGNDSLQGNEHNDTLYGDAGNDTLDGGTGNDYLGGGAGADTYLFAKGSGQDTVYNYDGDTVGTNADTIKLGAGILPSGVTLTRSGDDLLIGLNGTNDSLRVQSYFYADGVSGYSVENLVFADGTSWNLATVKAKVQQSTSGNDVLYGYATNDSLSSGDGNDTVYGYGGDDVLDGGTGADNLQGGDGNDTVKGGTGADYLYGGNGNDSLQGNEHNDTLYGDAGSDTLDGGTGNDYLSGGAGADTYLFAKGSGQDTVYNYDGDTVGTNADTIKLGAAILPSGVTLTRSGDDLLIGLNGTNDSLRVQSYFYADGASGYSVENLVFADGTSWNVAAVTSRLSTVPTPTTLYVNGTSASELLSGGLGNDTLYGAAGNDTLSGGAGNDLYDGGAGSDIYLFGPDSGNDTISAYDSTAGKLDVLQFVDGVSPSSVSLRRDGESLLVSIAGSTSTMRVNNYFNGDAAGGYQVEELRFSNGTSWNVATVKSKVQASSSEDDVLYGYAVADSLSGQAGDDTLYGRAGNDTLDGGAGDDALYGDEGNDVMRGGTQNDVLYGGAGNDDLQGQEGNDTLYGGEGNDNLSGGVGNDLYDGGAGSDIYLFGPDSGNDTISAYDSTAGKLDVLQFVDGVSPSSVSLRRDGESLLVSIAGSTSTMRVNNYFNGDAAGGYQVEELRFSNGTSWNVATVKSKVQASSSEDDVLYGYAVADSLSGQAGDDTLYGRAGNDTLDGGAGDDALYGDEGNDVMRGGTQNDVLYGGAGNDDLQGQEGNDTLYGGEGNDNLSGGVGNDLYDGGAGSDIYLFGPDSGNDTISAYDSTAGKLDVLQFVDGVSPSSVSLRRDGESLLVSIAGSTSTMRVNNYFYGDAAGGYQVEELRFSNGTSWNVATVKSKVQASSSEDDVLYGYAVADSLSGQAGDDTLYGRAGNDTLDGGAGDDALYGDEGNDVMRGGTQNDVLYGGAGNDDLQGQEGNDTLYGGEGNDNLSGGVGNDLYDGGAGSDIYLFGPDSGNDTISAYDSTAGKLDVLQFVDGVSPSSVSLRRDGESLLVSIAGSTSTMRVNNYFYGDAAGGYQAEELRFSNGTSWNVATVKSKVQASSSEDEVLYGYAVADSLSGQAGDDTLYGRAGNDTLDGGAGDDALYGDEGNDVMRGGTQNDVLYGGAGNDDLQGQEGADTLYGGEGSDILSGGAGNDVYDGGAGNDTYVFAKGAQSDVVNQYDGSGSDNDRVAIGAGISEDQVWFQRVGNDLRLSLIETNDQLTMRNWYSGSAYQVDGFDLANGKTLLDSQVNALVSAMAAFSPPVPGQTTLPADYQSALAPTLAASWK